MSLIVWLVVGVALIAALQLWVLWAQRRMSFWPDPTRTGPNFLAGFSEVEISTADDEVLVCWWYAPQDDNSATVLFFSGNSGTIADRAAVLAPLAEAGYGVLGVNYRGYGGSTGKPSEKGIYADGDAVLAWLQKTQDVPLSSIVAYGQSIGGTVATHLAAQNDLAGVVLESAFISADAMARRIIPYLPLWWFMTYRFDNLTRIKKARCPVLIVHGQQDETVPFRDGQALFRAAPEPKRFYAVARAAHNNIFEAGGAPYREYLLNFIQACRQGEEPPPVPEAGAQQSSSTHR